MKQTKRYRKRNNEAEKTNTRTNNDMNYEGNSRRPILYSSEDVETMAVESSRARLVMKLLSEPEEQSDKTDYYFSKSNVNAEIPVTKRNFSTYPTLVQGLRWNPSLETYSEDSQTDTSGEDGKFKCKCHTCEMNSCLAQRNLQKNTNNYTFKDNIVKFSDNSTMTRNLRESGCGVRTPLPTANTSEVSISTSDVTVKEVLRIQTPQRYPSNPAPILKKSDFQTNQNLGKEINHRVTVGLENSVNNNVGSDYENLLKSYMKQPIVPAPSNKNDFGDSRKALYNEGVSNSIAKNILLNFPPRTKRIKSQIKFENCCRPQRTNKRSSGKQTVIPFTHHTNSKYHYDCKEQNYFNNRKIQEDSNYITISPEPMQLERYDIRPSIRLPKRVLTSERNIEAYMDKRPTKMSYAFKR